MLGGGCEKCCKAVNYDCFRIANLNYILGWACCGASGGGGVIVVVVEHWCDVNKKKNVK